MNVKPELNSINETVLHMVREIGEMLNHLHELTLISEAANTNPEGKHDPEWVLNKNDQMDAAFVSARECSLTIEMLATQLDCRFSSLDEQLKRVGEGE